MHDRAFLSQLCYPVRTGWLGCWTASSARPRGWAGTSTRSLSLPIPSTLRTCSVGFPGARRLCLLLQCMRHWGLTAASWPSVGCTPLRRACRSAGVAHVAWTARMARRVGTAKCPWVGQGAQHCGSLKGPSEYEAVIIGGTQCCMPVWTDTRVVPHVFQAPGSHRRASSAVPAKVPWALILRKSVHEALWDDEGGVCAVPAGCWALVRRMVGSSLWRLLGVPPVCTHPRSALKQRVADAPLFNTHRMHCAHPSPAHTPCSAPLRSHLPTHAIPRCLRPTRALSHAPPVQLYTQVHTHAPQPLTASAPMHQCPSLGSAAMHHGPSLPVLPCTTAPH